MGFNPNILRSQLALSQWIAEGMAFAITQCTAQGATLAIDMPWDVATGNVVFTCPVVFVGNGQLFSTGATRTLGFTLGFNAPLQKIFGANVTVTFAAPVGPKMSPYWWGATQFTSAAVTTAANNAMYASAAASIAATPNLSATAYVQTMTGDSSGILNPTGILTIHEGALFFDGTNATRCAFTAALSGAAFLGTIATGAGISTLTVNSVQQGTIVVGQALWGGSVTQQPRTTISSQSGGTPGGAGTYILSQAVTAIASETDFYTSLLRVSAVASGSLSKGYSFWGTGVRRGTNIIGQLAGAAGGIGDYMVNMREGIAQNIGSEDMKAYGHAVVFGDYTSNHVGPTAGVHVLNVRRTTLGWTATLDPDCTSCIGFFNLTNVAAQIQAFNGLVCFDEHATLSEANNIAIALNYCTGGLIQHRQWVIENDGFINQSLYEGPRSTVPGGTASAELITALEIQNDSFNVMNGNTYLQLDGEVAQASQASFTASIGARATGTSALLVLTLTGTTGFVSPGDTVMALGVPTGTTIVSQSSGPTGGDGDYVTSANCGVTAAAITIQSTILNVTAKASGTLAATYALSDGNFIAPTRIVAQLSGAAGGVGTYSLDQLQQADSASGLHAYKGLSCAVWASGSIPNGVAITESVFGSGMRREGAGQYLYGGDLIRNNRFDTGHASYLSTLKETLILPMSKDARLRLAQNTFDEPVRFPIGREALDVVAELNPKTMVIEGGRGTRPPDGVIITFGATNAFAESKAGVSRTENEESSSSQTVGRGLIFSFRNVQQDIQFKMPIKVDPGDVAGGRLGISCYDISGHKLIDRYACNQSYNSTIDSYRTGSDFTAINNQLTLIFDWTRVAYVVIAGVRGTGNFTSRRVLFFRNSDSQMHKVGTSTLAAYLGTGGPWKFYDPYTAVSPGIPDASAIYGAGMIVRNTLAAHLVAGIWISTTVPDWDPVLI